MSYYRYTLFLLSSLLISLFSCGNTDSVHHFSQRDSVIQCDIEHLDSSRKYLLSNVSGVDFTGGAARVKKYAHSGQFSVKIEKDNPYSLSSVFKVSADEEYLISVWRYIPNDSITQNKAALVVTLNKNAYYFSEDKPDTATKQGWQHLQLLVRIPPEIKQGKMKVYVYLASSKEAYFDDILVAKRAKGYPVYPSLHTLKISLDSNAVNTLFEVRATAFKRKVLLSEFNKWVKGKIEYEGKEYPVKLRLKGDWLDHLQGSKWSFRIKMKDDNFKGMKEFSIQNPRSRYFLDEWLLHRMLRKIGVLTTRYGFVPVTLNGKSLGIYAYEEHFVKQLIESQKNREAPIMKFTDDQLWICRTHGGESPDVFDAAKIKAFKQKKILRNAVLRNHLFIARNLMSIYQKGEEQDVDDVFDETKLAKFYAITDVARSYHGLIWHNMRYYYNPISCKLEPIAFDGYTEDGVFVLKQQAIFGNTSWFPLPDMCLFSDSSFAFKYADYLTAFSDSLFIDSILKENKSEIDSLSEILRKEFPAYRFDYSFLKKNAQVIRKELPAFREHIKKLSAFKVNRHNGIYPNPVPYFDDIPPAYVHAYRQDANTIKVINYYKTEIELQAVGSKKKKQDIEKQLVPSYFKIPKIITVHCKQNNPSYLFFKVKGQGDMLALKIDPLPMPLNFSPYIELKNNNNILTHSVRGIEVANGKVIFKSGDIVLSNPVFIPQYQEVIFEAGASVDLKNGAFIISYSPVEVRGTAGRQVKLYSSDSTGEGLFVLNAKQKSVLNYLTIENQRAMSYKKWSISGAVTFYNTTVEINHTTFLKNYSEDALNVVNSTFEIKNTEFKNIFSDAFDSDFSNGTVSLSHFENIGNDAVDVSGTSVLVKDCDVESVGDKAVSGGEASAVTVNNVRIINANIGLASKDKSRVTAKNTLLQYCKYGVVAFQKKAEYGEAYLWLEKMELKKNNTDFYIEKGSAFFLDGKKIKGTKKEVVKLFYKR